MVVNQVQLFAEVVERETHNIEEVSMNVFDKHASQSLDTVATGLVPDTHTHRRKYFTLTATIHTY